MSSDSNQTKRKKRFSAAEARAALLEAGAQLLEERGFGRGMDRVTLGDAVIKSSVPRPSAYRLYAGLADEPQVEFRRELLLYLLDDSVDVGRSEAGIEAAAATMADLGPLIRSGDGRQMAAALRETIRRASNYVWRNANTRAAASKSAALSLALDPDTDPVLVEAYRARQTRLIEGNRGFFQQVLCTFGLRVKPGLSLGDLASHAAVAGEQVWDGWLIHGREPSIKRPTGVDRAKMLWSPFGVTVEGLFLVMVEPDPNAPASADLRVWLQDGC